MASKVRVSGGVRVHLSQDEYILWLDEQRRYRKRSRQEIIQWLKEIGWKFTSRNGIHITVPRRPGIPSRYKYHQYAEGCLLAVVDRYRALLRQEAQRVLKEEPLSTEPVRGDQTELQPAAEEPSSAPVEEIVTEAAQEPATAPSEEPEVAPEPAPQAEAAHEPQPAEIIEEVAAEVVEEDYGELQPPEGSVVRVVDGLAWIALDESHQSEASDFRMSLTDFARAKNNARRRDVRKVAENHWAELERIASIELRRRERQWIAGNGAKRETTVEELYLTAGQCMCLAMHSNDHSYKEKIGRGFDELGRRLRQGSALVADPKIDIVLQQVQNINGILDTLNTRVTALSNAFEQQQKALSDFEGYASTALDHVIQSNRELSAHLAAQMGGLSNCLMHLRASISSIAAQASEQYERTVVHERASRRVQQTSNVAHGGRPGVWHVNGKEYFQTFLVPELIDYEFRTRNPEAPVHYLDTRMVIFRQENKLSASRLAQLASYLPNFARQRRLAELAYVGSVSGAPVKDHIWSRQSIIDMSIVVEAWVNIGCPSGGYQKTQHGERTTRKWRWNREEGAKKLVEYVGMSEHDAWQHVFANEQMLRNRLGADTTNTKYPFNKAYVPEAGND